MVKGILEHAPPLPISWPGSKQLTEDAKMEIVSRGYSLNWNKEQKKELFQAAIKAGHPYTLGALAAARRAWETDLLKNLALGLASSREANSWQVKRVVHLGNIKVDKALVRACMNSPIKEIRVLSQAWLCKLPNNPSVKNSIR